MVPSFIRFNSYKRQPLVCTSTNLYSSYTSRQFFLYSNEMMMIEIHIFFKKIIILIRMWCLIVEMVLVCPTAWYRAMNVCRIVVQRFLFLASAFLMALKIHSSFVCYFICIEEENKGKEEEN